MHAPQRLYGLIGHPVGHSLSPRLHTWGFSQLQIPAVYMAWDIPGSELAAFMLAMRTLPIHGVSVTLPLKQQVIPYLDHMTEQAVCIRAVNTLFWQEGVLWGDNTDWLGVLRPLQDRSLSPQRTLVLGAGGAALSAVAALRHLGCPRIMVAGRNKARVQQVFPDPDVICLDWDQGLAQSPDLLINTTPVGMSGPEQDRSPVPESALASVAWVFDLIYNPRQTKLLQQAARAGCCTISGLEMFVHQARGQCRLWTGRNFDRQQALELLGQ